MGRVLDRLCERHVLVSDGGWGTLIMGRGLKGGDCAELWSVEHPEVLVDIGRQYVAAGADLITTNSFGGSRFNLERYGLGARTVEINKAAAAASREAAGEAAVVCASMGPTGKMLLTEEVSEQEMFEAFAEQAAALEAGGADGILIETMTAADEAALAIRAARTHTRLDVLCTFTFAIATDGVYRTMMGTTAAEMAAVAIAEGADIIGSNCGQGPSVMAGIVAALHAAAPEMPILAQPNAGMPMASEEGSIWPESPEAMGARVPDLVAAGARLVGGCCGTTPAHIRAVRRAVDALLPVMSR